MTSGMGMDQLKQTLMTMFMFKNMNSSSSSSSNDMFNMVYVFIITQIVDLIVKYLPIIINNIYDKYSECIKTEIIKTSDEIINHTTNKIMKKSASIIITISSSDPENTIGQSLVDIVTNCINTKHVKYLKQNYMLNENTNIYILNQILL